MRSIDAYRSIGVCAILALAAVACGGDATLPCVSIGTPAVYLDVRDSATSHAYTGPLTARIIDGTYSDSLKVSGSTALNDTVMLVLGNPRAGTYRAEVDAPGYLHWSKTGLVATTARCGVNGAHATTLLVRDTSPTDLDRPIDLIVPFSFPAIDSGKAYLTLYAWIYADAGATLIHRDSASFQHPVGVTTLIHMRVQGRIPYRWNYYLVADACRIDGSTATSVLTAYDQTGQATTMTLEPRATPRPCN